MRRNENEEPETTTGVPLPGDRSREVVTPYDVKETKVNPVKTLSIPGHFFDLPTPSAPAPSVDIPLPGMPPPPAPGTKKAGLPKWVIYAAIAAGLYLALK